MQQQRLIICYEKCFSILVGKVELSADVTENYDLVITWREIPGVTSYVVEGDHDDGLWSSTKYPGDPMEYVERRMYLGNTYNLKVDAFYTENFKVSSNTTVLLGLYVLCFVYY